MSEKVYYSEPYRKELDSLVQEVLEDGLVLSATIFYPEGGGQPGDRGTIDGIEVKDTVHRGEKIVHIMDDTSAFTVGQSVHAVLDWDHRYRFMKAHSAEHMIAGTFYTALSIGVVAIHLADDFLTVEVDIPKLSLEDARRVEALVNRAILEDHRITATVLPHSEAEALGLRRSIKVEGDVRIVDIESIDRIACGGVQVASTREVGAVSYAGQEVLRGHVRTIWYHGDSVARHAHEERDVLSVLTAKLSSPIPQLPDAVSRLVDEVKDVKAKLRAHDEMIASLLLDKGETCFISPVETSCYQRFASGGRTFFAVYDRGERRDWILCTEDEAVFAAFKGNFASLGAKGGGRSPLYQGSASAPADTLLQAASEAIGGKE